MRWVLAVLLFARVASAFTIAGGESDTSNSLWWFIPAAGCVGGTGFSNWDLTGTDVPTAACATNTNLNKGVLTFPNSGGSITKPSAQQTLLLPAAPLPATASYVATAPITVTLMWYAPAACTLETRWCAAVVCRGNAEVDDNTVSFGTEVCVEDTCLTTPQLNLATITLPTASTTTCAPNELLHLKLSRDSANAGDDMTGDANLVSATVAWQRFE